MFGRVPPHPCCVYVCARVVKVWMLWFWMLWFWWRFSQEVYFLLLLFFFLLLFLFLLHSSLLSLQMLVLVTLLVFLFLALIAYMIYARDQVSSFFLVCAIFTWDQVSLCPRVYTWSLAWLAKSTVNYWTTFTLSTLIPLLWGNNTLGLLVDGLVRFWKSAFYCVGSIWRVLNYFYCKSLWSSCWVSSFTNSQFDCQYCCVPLVFLSRVFCVRVAQCKPDVCPNLLYTRLQLFFVSASVTICYDPTTLTWPHEGSQFCYPLT